MTNPAMEAEVSAARRWRFKLGLCTFVFAFALWLLIPLAVSWGAPSARIAALTGAIFVANKVLLLACIAVMGKAGFRQLKAIVFSRAKGLSPGGSVGPTRHAVGLVMFCLPLVSAILEPYVDQIWPGLRPNMWQMQALGDLMLLASFFVLGEDFWGKIRALVIRTEKVADDRDANAGRGDLRARTIRAP